MPKIPSGKRRSRRSQSVLAVFHSPRKASRRHWTGTQMKSAMDAVKKGGMSTKRAPLQYDVPKTTLQDRISGKVIHGTNPGARLYLNRAEEKELGEFIVTVGKIGFGKTHRQIKNIAEKVATEKEVKK